MYMKFIGKDGSMGLKHGRFYNTKNFSKNGLIFVQWVNNFHGIKCCPYKSPQSFAANWSK